MALVQKRNTKRSLMLAAALVVVVVGGAITILLINRNPSLTGSSSVLKRDLPILETFNEELLHSQAVVGLKSFGNIPVSNQPDPKGSPDPFHTSN